MGCEDKIIYINGIPIGEDVPPYIIAECCNNFNADMGQAFKLIEQAKLAGCNAVKFQMRLQPDRISPEQHKRLQDFCIEIGITYLCTAFDIEGADILNSMEVPAIKIGSGNMTNTILVEHVMEFGIPVIISTGMSSDEEIGDHIPIAEFPNDDNIIVMQSTSIYPCPYERVNLGFLQDLDLFCDYYGLSDHTPTIYTSIAAIALGAQVIEKHFTLNKNQPGPDQSSSLDYGEMKQLVEGCHAVWQVRGSEKKLFDEEIEKAKLYKFGYTQ